MIQYDREPAWDLTLEVIETLEDGLAIRAVKKSGTVPTAVANRYALGAEVLNRATGIWYVNTGTVSVPVFTTR